MGETYLGISLMDTHLGATKSIAPKLDGPVCVVPSPCTLMEVCVCLFYGNVEPRFSEFYFPIGIEEDLNSMLMTYSTIFMG